MWFSWSRWIAFWYTHTDRAAMEQFIADVIKHFTIKGLGEVSYFSGYYIAGSGKERVLKTIEHLYVKTIGERLEVLERSLIPAVVHSVHLSQANRPQTEAEMLEEMLGTRYREVAGALIMWASTTTRSYQGYASTRTPR